MSGGAAAHTRAFSKRRPTPLARSGPTHGTARLRGVQVGGGDEFRCRSQLTVAERHTRAMPVTAAAWQGTDSTSSQLRGTED